MRGGGWADAVRLLVTGAAGFIGGYVVAQALGRGHAVRALDRRARTPSAASEIDLDSVEWVEHDLCSQAGLEDLLDDVDAVIHLAAAMVGPFSVQVCDTVRGTTRLLEAMVATGVRRLVLVSSLSVYDFRALESLQVLDETAPLESHPADREPYCRAKLLQEELVRRYIRDHDLGATILRPGFVFGPGKTWSDQVGVRLGRRFWVRFTASGMPVALVYVENCAAAILDCVDSGPSEGNTFNVVDDGLPTRRQYVRELRLCATPAPWVIAIPGVALRAIARIVRRSNDVLLRSKLRLPWLLDPARLETQLKPLRFTNERLRTVVGWSPRVSRAEALDRCRRHAA